MSSGLPDPPDRDLLRSPRQEFLERHAFIRSAVCRSMSVAMKPGRDRVRGDVVPAELDREGLREALQARLGRGVVGLAAVAERARCAERLTIRPHFASTWYLCTSRVIRNAPRRCTPMTASQSSSVILNSRLSRRMPALLTRIVGAPSSSATACDGRRTCSASDTSAPTPTRPAARRADRLDGRPCVSLLVEVDHADGACRRRPAASRWRRRCRARLPSRSPRARWWESVMDQFASRRR